MVTALRYFGARGRRAAAAPAVAVLAVSVAATCVMASVASAMWFRPLPLPRSGELVDIELFGGGSPIGFGQVPTLQELTAWQLSAPHGVQLAGFSTSEGAVAAGNHLSSAPMIEVTSGMFELLGVPPAHGRFLAPGDFAAGAPPTAVLSSQLAAELFGETSAAVGARVEVNGAQFSVAGIMPAGFHIPLSLSYHDERPELWIPVQARAAFEATSSDNEFGVEVLGRIPDSVPRTFLLERLTQVARLDLPGGSGLHARASGVLAARSRDIAEGVLAASGAAIALFLLASLNLASFLGIHALKRAEEARLRVALGARTRDLVALCFCETSVLALLACGLGIAGAVIARPVLARFWGRLLPFETRLRIDPFAISTTLAAIFLCVVAASLLSLAFSRPWGSARVDISGRRESNRISPRARRALSAMLVLEMTISVALLLGSYVFRESVLNLTAFNLGFVSDRVELAAVRLPAKSFPNAKSQISFVERGLHDLAQDADIAGVGAGTGAPLVGGSVGSVRSDYAGAHTVNLWSEGGAYFQVLGIRAVAGRLPSDLKDVGSVVIDRAAARLFFGDKSPVGKRIYWKWLSERSGSVAAVVDNINEVAGADMGSLKAVTRPHVYVPLSDSPSLLVRFVIKLHASDLKIGPRIQALLLADDGGTAPIRAESAAALVQAQSRQDRIDSALLAVFAFLAVGIAGTGIYTSVSYVAQTRLHEMAVRMALGARPAAISTLLLTGTCRDWLLATVLGTAGAWFALSAISGLLFRVPRLATIPILTVGVFVGAVSLWAAIWPALGASRSDPARLLQRDA